MTMYPVNEIFDSLQGEGARTGRPSTFIRMQGCPVGCAWCDTRHTWARGHQVSIERMLEKSAIPSDEYAEMDAWMLTNAMESRGATHVVITGGEPAMHDLTPLTAALYARDIASQIETSGTFPLLAHRWSWVTCSPKIGMPGGREINRDVLARADEIKMPVGKLRDVELLIAEVMPFVRERTLIYLQPLSCSKKSTELCIEQAAKHGWSVSIQTHKFLGLR